MELIIVRHGETESNRNGTFLGWTDVMLNETGIRQAYCVKERLKGIKIDAIYSSPLIRAKRTAEIINENFQMEIEYIDGLKERNFGIWDDRTYHSIVDGYPREHELWTKDWMNYCIENGESAIQVYQRVTGAMNQLTDQKRKGTVLIVTHLGCIRMLLAYLLGLGIEGSWRFKVNNCSITKVEIDENYAVLSMLNG